MIRPPQVDAGGNGGFHSRMRSLHRCFRLALPAAAAALGAVAGCYPDVTFTGGPGDAGAGGDYAGTTASSASTAASSADV
ncbi:hypothetical protein BE21_05920, partial [Sorangium cellulosum]